jgi:hypothetical protein
MSAKQSSKAAPRGFDKDLAQLEALSAAMNSGAKPDTAQVQYLRSALTQHNNFLVSKAAKLIAEAELTALLPDVLTAYDRFFIDPVKTDPKCWAKEALARALVKLEHRAKDAYLRGMRHHQMEGSFGPPVDSAGGLRSICAHALVDCPGISDADLLAALLEPLTDTDKAVRVEAARAIAAVGGISAALLLRLRVMLGPGSEDNLNVEVLGAVYSALLSLEGERAIPLVSAVMDDGGELGAEAAYALADLRTPEALAPLIDRHRTGLDHHSAVWFSSVLLSAIALTRLPAAFDYLTGLISSDGRGASNAIESIGRIAPNAELYARVQQAVDQAGNPRLAQAFRQHVATPPTQT